MEFQVKRYHNKNDFGPDMDQLFERGVREESDNGWILVSFAYNTGGSYQEHWYITAVYKRKV